VTPTLHSNLLSAFLAGKSCSAIALTFNLSIEEVLAWFESDYTQSTLRRLESLQHQQARIVSFSVLPGAADSLTNTCHTADNPLLRTRAASNLVRLGLRFASPSKSPSLARGVAENAASAQPAAEIAAPAEHPTSTSRSHSSAPSALLDRADPFLPSASPSTNPRTNLLCESLRAEFAALRTVPTNTHQSSSRTASSKSPKANHRTEPAPRHEPAREGQTLAFEPALTIQPIAPLLSRRESRISSLRSSAGAIMPRDAFPALNRAPPRNLHPPSPIDSAA